MSLPATVCDRPREANSAAQSGERRAFLREAVRNPRNIGAVTPSSRSLVSALIEPVSTSNAVRQTVLEVGAGTGAITRRLIASMSPGSHLDVVEPNPRFAELLQHSLRARDGLVDGAITAQLHATTVEEMDSDRRYDVIVSGLPFANFEPEQVESILRRYRAVLRPGGTLAYFSYLGAAVAHRIFSTRAQTARHDSVADVLAAARQSGVAETRRIWANIPPAAVHYLEFAPARSGTAYAQSAAADPRGARPAPGSSTTAF